jgi:hypothetical protein
MDKEEKIGSTIEQLNTWYKDAIAYQTSIGLRTTIPECVKFYEGDQWAPATKNTKYFPRPVVNIIEMNVNNKKSQVLSSPIKIVYKSDNKEALVDKFNKFAEYEFGRLKQKDLNNKAVLDGSIKGSYCYYYYYDESIVGLDGIKEGDIAVQLIDPINVLFANPNEKDEQKQDWIMIVSREDINRIKSIADSDIDKTKIQDDDSESIYNEAESDTEKYATVLTRFFRHNGEVYFERATKEVIFNKARPFTPDVEHYKGVISGKQPEKQEKAKPEDRYKRSKKATLYPIVFSSWKERDKSIYGRGEVEPMIPNQKAINWTLGLQILIAQNEGMSPVVVSPDALRGQKITNEPGQVITDYSKTGNGVRFPNKPSMSAASVSLVDKIADLTRVVTGSSEVMNGETISAGMSGAAIAQLQAQALKPIQDLQKNFWRTMEKIGEVMEQFFRFFFNKKKFQYQDKKQNDKIVTEEFNSKDYENVHFDVIAEAVAGTVMSDVADINILESLYAKGSISLKTYINCYPDNAIANRQKLLDNIDEEETSIINNLQMQLQQTQAQLQQAVETLKQQEQTIANAQSIVDENRTLKEKIIALQAEYTQKVQYANRILFGLASKAKEYYSDAKSMAQEVAKGRGITTTPQTNDGSPSGETL